MSRKGEKRRWTEDKQINNNANSSGCEQGSGAPNSSHNKDKTNDESWLPEKHILELVLDTLQRRDTYDIFAEPVDPSEVEDYYEIITEPMDFGTMRAKLHEGLYKSLLQFEHDMYSIFDNATYFNPSGTVYFRQARVLEDLARKVFHALRTDLHNFELEYNVTKRRSSRKLEDEPRGGSILCSGQKHARDLGINTTTTDPDKKGGRKPRRSSMSDIDRRSTYNPWKTVLHNNKSTISPIFSDPQPLVHANPDKGYRKSLMSFVKDLGPTAKRVAERKLEELGTTQTTINHRNTHFSDSSTTNYQKTQFSNSSTNNHQKTHFSDSSTTNPQIPASESRFRTNANYPVYRPMSFTNFPYIPRKTDIMPIRDPNLRDQNNPFCRPLSLTNSTFVQQMSDFSVVKDVADTSNSVKPLLSLNSINPNENGISGTCETRSRDPNNPFRQEKTEASTMRETSENSKSVGKLDSLNSKNPCEITYQRKRNLNLKDQNNPFSRPISTSNFPFPQKKADAKTTSETPDKGKSVKTLDSSKIPKEKVISRKSDRNSKGNGTIVLGLVAIRDRKHRKSSANQSAPTKESKSSKSAKLDLDLNQAQPIPSNSKDNGLIARPNPFESIATNKASYQEHCRTEGVFKPSQNMAPLFSGQALFNVPYFEPRLNPSLPAGFQQGFNNGWCFSGNMNFGQASSSQGYAGRNGFLDMNHPPSTQGWRHRF